MAEPSHPHLQSGAGKRSLCKGFGWLRAGDSQHGALRVQGWGCALALGGQRSSQTILLPSGGSRGGITAKPGHKNRGCACSVVHLSDRAC